MAEFARQRHEHVQQPKTAIHSPIYNTACSLLNKAIQQQGLPEAYSDKGKQILEAIDNQGVESYEVYNSSKFPGVAFPYSKVSLDKLLDQISYQPKSETPQITDQIGHKKTVHVIFPGSGFFLPDGHPFTPWDMVYDRVIGLLPQAIAARKDGGPLPDVYIVGVPSSFAGRVTTEWVSALKQSGFDNYGQLYEELLGPIFESIQKETPNMRIILNGLSMGTASLDVTKKYLSEDIQKHVQILADNPVKGHFIQIPIGFGLELIKEGVKELIPGQGGRLRDYIKGLKRFYQEMAPLLEKKGISIEDNKEALKLKRQTANTDLWNLMRGTPTEKNPQAYIRRGMFDPLSFSPLKLPGRLRRHKNYTSLKVGDLVTENDKINLPQGREFPIKSAHAVNRYRVKKWVRVIGKLFSILFFLAQFLLQTSSWQ